jgi:hypothetical protein
MWIFGIATATWRHRSASMATSPGLKKCDDGKTPQPTFLETDDIRESRKFISDMAAIQRTLLTSGDTILK